MSSNITVQRRCEFCHQEFPARTTVTRFCSMTCNSRSLKAKARALKVERSNEETVKAGVETKKSFLTKELLTVNDIVELLGFSKQGVYNLINDGHLKAVKITERKTRIKKNDFQDFLARREQEPIAKKEVVKGEQARPLTRESCYGVNELTALFDKNRGDLYVFLNRAGVSKIKIKKEVFFSKAEIDKLFRKFTSPKQVGHDKEREANLKLAKKGFKLTDCYTMEQCEQLFGQKRGNLYNKFSLRKVPKIKHGQSVYYLKKAVDKIYQSMKGGTEL
jgi:excisionase family DNA binding protein